MGHKIKDKGGRRQPTKRIQIIRVQTTKSIIKNKKNKKERLAEVYRSWQQHMYGKYYGWILFGLHSDSISQQVRIDLSYLLFLRSYVILCPWSIALHPFRSRVDSSLVRRFSKILSSYALAVILCL